MTVDKYTETLFVNVHKHLEPCMHINKRKKFPIEKNIEEYLEQRTIHDTHFFYKLKCKIP